MICQHLLRFLTIPHLSGHRVKLPDLSLSSLMVSINGFFPSIPRCLRLLYFRQCVPPIPEGINCCLPFDPYSKADAPKSFSPWLDPLNLILISAVIQKNLSPSISPFYRFDGRRYHIPGNISFIRHPPALVCRNEISCYFTIETTMAGTEISLRPVAIWSFHCIITPLGITGFFQEGA